MVGKNISVSGSAGLDAVTVSISGDVDDLETGLQLAHQLITDAKIEPADIDGDGHVDLVNGERFGRIVWSAGLGGGQQGPARLVDVHDQITDLALADLDGDTVTHTTEWRDSAGTVLGYRRIARVDISLSVFDGWDFGYTLTRFVLTTSVYRLCASSDWTAIIKRGKRCLC